MPATPDATTEIPVAPPSQTTPQRGRPASRTVEITAPATAETIPSETLQLMQRYAARLHDVPMAVDEVEGAFADVYRNMADTDPQVSSSVDILTLMTTAQDLRVESRVQKGEERYDEADLYRRFIAANLKRLDRSVSSLNYEMDEAATVEGHHIAEIVLEWGPNIDPANDNPQLWLKAIKTKARHTYVMYVNAFNDWAGVLPLHRYGQVTPLSEADLIKRLVPRAKLMYRVNHARNSDPRGTSDLHDVYNIWWLNVQNWALMIQAHAQFAVPTAIFTEAPMGQAQWTNSTGQPMTPLQAAQAGLTIAKSVKSSAAIRLANGQTLEYLQATSATEQCLAFRELVVKEIGKAITNQSLATDQGQHQTGMAASTHKDMLGLKPRHHQYELAHMWEHDLFTYLIRLNYGDTAVEMVPKALLGQTQMWDISSTGQMFAQMGANEEVFPSQLPQIHSGMEMPRATQEEYDHYSAYWLAKYDPKNAVPQKAGANGGAASPSNKGAA